MPYEGGKYNDSGAFGGYQDSAGARFVSDSRDGFQGIVRLKDAQQKSLPNAYGGSGSNGSRAQGQYHDKQKGPFPNPHHNRDILGTSGYVPDGPMKVQPTISRPSYATRT